MMNDLFLFFLPLPLLPPLLLPLPLLLLPLLLLPLPLLLLLLGLRHLLLHHLQEILVLRPFCLVVHRTTWAIWILNAWPNRSRISLSSPFQESRNTERSNRLRTTFVCLRMFLCQFYVHIWSTCGSL